MTQLTPDDLYEKYGKKFAKNDTWRMWPVAKQQLAFGLGYLLLREIPIRNFYARSFIMGSYFLRYFNFYGIPFPAHLNTYGNIRLDYDESTA